MAYLIKFLGDESGATAVEYGLITALFVVAIVGGLSFMAGGMTSTLSSLQQTVNH